jgi:hypothetical protein
MTKPAGWMDDYEFYTNEQYEEFDEGLQDGLIPLYKHPSKQLTDQEIQDTYESSYLQSGLDEWEFDPVYFAREILRKAQA